MMSLKRLGLAGALASTLAFGGACGTTNEMLGRNQQTWSMQADSRIPAAEGKVQVATADNGNRDLKVEVKHMAKPDTVFTGASTYVVWLKPENGRAQNLGVLPVDKDLNGKLETTTSFTNFVVMVTAETTAQPTGPSRNEVLVANVVVPS
jgi:hypothetical protein